MRKFKLLSIIPLLLIAIFSFFNVSMAKLKTPKIIRGLVELNAIDKTFYYDLRYATKNNFTKTVLYHNAKVLLNINTAHKLIKANNYLKKFGYHIKIYDAYRPHSVQVYMWHIYPNKNYLANPKIGSNHNKGAAVDITLVDNSGKELSMPSTFDEFSNRAHIDYEGAPKDALAHRELLAKAMVLNGFRRISKEWWHFDDIDYKKYPILDIPFSSF